MKQSVKDTFAVVLFLLLFPYFAMSFWQQKHVETDPETTDWQQQELELTTQLADGKYFVYWEKNRKKSRQSFFWWARWPAVSTAATKRRH